MIYTGVVGTPLKDIIFKYGNKNYDVIQCRVKYKDQEGVTRDESFGYCKYIDGKLIPLDEKIYSLNDLYTEWSEATSGNEQWLIVWKHGESRIGDLNGLRSIYQY